MWMMSDVVIVVKWILMWTQQLVAAKIMKMWCNSVTCLIWNPCLGWWWCITFKIHCVCPLLVYFTYSPVVTGSSNFETIKTPSYMVSTVRTVSLNIWDVWSPYLSPQTDHFNWGFMIFWRNLLPASSRCKMEAGRFIWSICTCLLHYMVSYTRRH